MPQLNSYDVEMVLVQKNIRAETSEEAAAVMDSNIKTKGYVKLKAVKVDRTNI